jgi:hypothetical protein
MCVYAAGSGMSVMVSWYQLSPVREVQTCPAPGGAARFDFISGCSIPRDLPSLAATLRLNPRLIRGRSAAAGTVRSVPSCLVTDDLDRRRTVSNRIGKRVGETLKSSNLLSSASGLARANRKRATPALWVGEVARLNHCLGPRPGPRPPGQPGGVRWRPLGRRGLDAAAG